MASAWVGGVGDRVGGHAHSHPAHPRRGGVGTARTPGFDRSRSGCTLDSGVDRDTRCQPRAGGSHRSWTDWPRASPCRVHCAGIVDRGSRVVVRRNCSRVRAIDAERRSRTRISGRSAHTVLCNARCRRCRWTVLGVVGITVRLDGECPALRARTLVAFRARSWFCPRAGHLCLCARCATGHGCWPPAGTPWPGHGIV